MDRRRKHFDPERERALRDAFDEDIVNHRLSIPAAVKMMRRLSHLTQAEFAKHRGISIITLKQIESGKAQPKVETLNKIGEIFGLEVAFTLKKR
ncbi:MAG: helix-turn-helix domain-containing protein [Sulfurisoma sp.]|nr:helix-turn-helix domain-containing protein [Sulfurisoma sp.]